MESPILKKIMLAVGSLANVRVFRNNTGMGWAGKVAKRTENTIVLKDYRPLHAGLTKGSSDLVGWTTITITPDMVGKQLAVFTAIEAKTDVGRPTDEQMNFINAVRSAGGYAGVARSPEEAKKITENT